MREWPVWETDRDRLERWTYRSATAIVCIGWCVPKTTIMFYCWTTDDTTNNWSYCIQVTWLVVTEVRSESFGLVTERCHDNARHIYQSASYVRQVLFFIVECGIARLLCAMHIFDVRHHPHPLGYLCGTPPTAELACREKSRTVLNQSINHSPSLFDVPGTEAFASELPFICQHSAKLSI